MYLNQKKSKQSARRGRPQQAALERLDAFLESNKNGSNAELIRALMKTMFGYLEESEESGQAEIPG